MKQQKNAFRFLRWILALIIAGLLGKELIEFDEKAWSFVVLQRPLSLVAAMMLVYPNIWMAFAKWRETLRVIQVSSSRKKRVHSFFAGIVTGMLTPNMLGNFIGRAYYYPRRYRIQIIMVTLLSNFAQFLVSLTFGVCAIFFAGEAFGVSLYSGFIAMVVLVSLVSYGVYFNIEKWLKMWKKKGYTERFRVLLKSNPWFRWKILVLSLGRFILFTAQFALALNAFGENIRLHEFLTIWQVYLFTMIFPSLLLGKLGIKEFVAVSLLSAIGMNKYVVLISSLFIWLINSMTPAVIGLILCKKPGQND